ncbi:MAG: DALR anticodon-binding domain-containing protein [Clostridia bacterium]|nr:DALR anticodon-binding domain-containing protein [Clostridia bacterium]
MPKVEDVDYSKLTEIEAINTLKNLYQFNETIQNAASKNEPSILARYLIDLSQNFSTFYNEYKIITQNKATQDARLFLTYAVRNSFKNRGRIIRNGNA